MLNSINSLKELIYKPSFLFLNFVFVSYKSKQNKETAHFKRKFSKIGLVLENEMETFPILPSEEVTFACSKICAMF